MAEDRQLREFTCDPKQRKVLVTDGKTALGQALVKALRRGRRRAHLGRPRRALEEVRRVRRAAEDSPGDAAAARRHRLEERARARRGDRRQGRHPGEQRRVPPQLRHRQPPGRRDRARRDGRQLLRPAAPRAGIRPGDALARRRRQASAVAWVNLLSIYAHANFPPHGTFSASKAAAHSLAQCLRAEMRPAGVRVVNVFPGPIDDEWNQLLPPPKLAPDTLAQAASSARCATASRTSIPATWRRNGSRAGAIIRKPWNGNFRHEPLLQLRRRPIADRENPRGRSHADPLARIPQHLAAAGDGPGLAVPHRGGVALRRARPGLVLEQLLLRRAHRHALRRAGALGLGQGPAEQRHRHHPARALHRPGVRHRLLQGSGAGPRFPADQKIHRRLGKQARSHRAAVLGADAHRLVEAPRPGRIPELRRGRPAHARARRRGGEVPGRRARRARLRHRIDRHRRRPGVPPAPALPVPLLHARRRPLRPAVPDQPRPASADRRGRHRRAAQDPQRQRQSRYGSSRSVDD